MILKREARAGGFANQRYRAGLKSWRRRIRWISIAISGPLVLVGIAGFFWLGHPLAWIAGGLTALGMSAWTWLRDTPPEYIENWHYGAEGERKTEKALRPLERAGWQVVHDVQNSYGNYDHIAVSSAGVFLLDTKNLGGIVELRDGVPHLRRRLDPEDDKPWGSIPRSARGAAAGLKEDIEGRTGQRIWVQAVVVFWSEFPEGLVEDGKCVFIHGSRLREWMQSRPDRLSQADVEEISAGVESIAADEPANTVVPVSPGLSPA